MPERLEKMDRVVKEEGWPCRIDNVRIEPDRSGGEHHHGYVPKRVEKCNGEVAEQQSGEISRTFGVIWSFISA